MPKHVMFRDTSTVAIAMTALERYIEVCRERQVVIGDDPKHAGAIRTNDSLMADAQRALDDIAAGTYGDTPAPEAHPHA